MQINNEQFLFIHEEKTKDPKLTTVRHVNKTTSKKHVLLGYTFKPQIKE